jgi:hypothetical protein
MRQLRAITLVLLTSFASTAPAQTRIMMKSSFIEKYKNRVTIDATYTVDKAHPHPNPAAKDADMHIAGRAPEIGLPTVAEIMNAVDDKDAVDKVHEVEGTGKPVAITGAWRLWPEHGGVDDQVQGAHLDPFDTTNPEHVFEVHPVTKVATFPTSSSIRWIEGYTPKDAQKAFEAFENHKCKLTYSPSKKTTTIETAMIGDNYVEFMIELNEAPHKVADGYMVMAQVMTTDSEPLIHKRRMVFIEGTAEANAVKDGKKGDVFHVLGIPRVDLALVSYRTAHRAADPDAMTWNLPYEMIIVGVKQ